MATQAFIRSRLSDSLIPLEEYITTVKCTALAHSVDLLAPGAIEKVVVTKYPAMVEHLKLLELIDDTTPVLNNVTAEDVAGKHVFGMLPLKLAVHAACITEITLSLHREQRDKELSLSELSAAASEPTTYVVTRIPTRRIRYYDTVDRSIPEQ